MKTEDEVFLDELYTLKKTLNEELEERENFIKTVLEADIIKKFVTIVVSPDLENTEKKLDKINGTEALTVLGERRALKRITRARTIAKEQLKEIKHQIKIVEKEIDGIEKK